MNSVIFNPLEEYETRLRELHFQNVENYLKNLVEISGINIEENRRTLELYSTYINDVAQLRKTYNLWRFLRVLMIITLVLIPVVIMKTTPKIQELRNDIETADAKAAELLQQAHQQMAPLNNLFTDTDCLNIIHETIPLMSFDSCFSATKEADMVTNFDFNSYTSGEESTLEVLSGDYNENPFLFEKRFIHYMGSEVYHGYKTITWTETYRDSNGNLCKRNMSQTLHASVTKPKPFFRTHVVLNYGSQGGPELSFSREASHLEGKSDKAIERIVKRGEKKIKKMTDKAISQDSDFMSMSNSEFEVLFNALDRNNEVQFRTLFTPLAQTNLVSLIRSEVGYGDDFNFLKRNRMNFIASEHSQGRDINISPEVYKSYSYDIIKESFISSNIDFFKAVYFDFAPILAIPVYQERPVHSLKPIPDYVQQYSCKECESLANALDRSEVVHPDTKTPAILKSEYVGSNGNVDETCISAYSYDIVQRYDYVTMLGGDGYYHDVEVPWDEYIPLEAQKHFYVTVFDEKTESAAMAVRNGLCISEVNFNI